MMTDETIAVSLEQIAHSMSSAKANAASLAAGEEPHAGSAEAEYTAATGGRGRRRGDFPHAVWVLLCGAGAAHRRIE